MDETQTGILSQNTHHHHHQLPKPKFHNESSQQQLIADNHIHSRNSSNSSSSSGNIIANKNNINNISSSATTTSTTTTITSRKSISSSNPLNEFLKPHSILSQNNSSESDDDPTHDEINLYPLSNQVGGHTRLLLLNDKTVIKPLNIRELEFYQNIPGNDIQHFVPKYKGT
jgi:hypothetical protein